MLHPPEKSAAILRSKFRTTFARRLFRLGSAAATAIAAPILCTISSLHPLRSRFLDFSRRRRRRQRTPPLPDTPERLAVISFPGNFRLGNPGSRHPRSIGSDRCQAGPVISDGKNSQTNPSKRASLASFARLKRRANERNRHS